MQCANNDSFSWTAMNSNAGHSIPAMGAGRVDLSSRNGSLRSNHRMRSYFIALEKLHVAEVMLDIFPALFALILMARSLLEVNCGEPGECAIAFAQTRKQAKGESPCKPYVSPCAN
jgi:hypothetical protein